jgi:putative holliday junction resolvase
MIPSGRILAVDPGEKKIGIAMSDPTGSIAKPLKVILHVSRLIDAAAIAQFATENQVALIVIGQALGGDGEMTSQARHSSKLGEAIQIQTNIPVVFWDESGSTQEARSVRVEMGVVRNKRSGHLDDVAAAVILQSYLDAHR